MLALIGFIITGFIVGLIARALKPGDDRMSIAKTTLLGIIGSVLAGALGHIAGWYHSGDGASFLGATIGAVAVLFIYNAFSHRKMIHHH